MRHPGGYIQFSGKKSFRKHKRWIRSELHFPPRIWARTLCLHRLSNLATVIETAQLTKLSTESAPRNCTFVCNYNHVVLQRMPIKRLATHLCFISMDHIMSLLGSRRFLRLIPAQPCHGTASSCAARPCRAAAASA